MICELYEQYTFQFLQGLIKTHIQWCGSRSSYSFQFLQGLIKTKNDDGTYDILNGFNSYKVWLKRDRKNYVFVPDDPFQFLQGLIKTCLPSSYPAHDLMFQFLQGLIKTAEKIRRGRREKSFNSYKVWLKLNVECIELPEATPFQFLQGLIKTQMLIHKLCILL